MKITITALLLLAAITAGAQGQSGTETKDSEAIHARIADMSHEFDATEKLLEDLLWYDKVGDIAFVDKVRLTGPPRHRQTPTGNAFHDALLDNDLVFHSYVFIPKKTKQNRKYPLVVFSHGGIHGTFTTVYAHVIRELIAQGYIVVAPDYRGSTGYGKGFYRSIDYGGRENDDVLAATRYMIENYSIVDPERIGLLGWSHGGMITLMNACRHPETYACAYAGVPVSDVAFRLEYQNPGYADEFTAPYHIGKTPEEAPGEYARRSPVTYAKELQIPLMITTAENDDDVSVLEVKRMIDSLKFHRRDFEYRIYPPMPGAHLFDRIDTGEATRIRFLAYEFLARYLAPPAPFKSPETLRKAGYRFN